MANVNFSNDPKDLALIDALCASYGYQAQISDSNGQLIPNPETKEQFAKKQVKKFMRAIYKSYVVTTAADTARKDAEQNFNNNNPEE